MISGRKDASIFLRAFIFLYSKRHSTGIDEKKRLGEMPKHFPRKIVKRW